MTQPQHPAYDEETRREIDAMVAAEERYLAGCARRDARPGEAPAPPRITSRRSFLTAAAAVVGAGGLLPQIILAKAPPGAVERPVPADPTREQGVPTGDDGGYGSRSQFETRFPRER